MGIKENVMIYAKINNEDVSLFEMTVEFFHRKKIRCSVEVVDNDGFFTTYQVYEYYEDDEHKIIAALDHISDVFTV